MKKLLFSVFIISIMTACEQKPGDVSSTGSDSTAVASTSSAEEKEERNKQTALAISREIGGGNLDSGFVHLSTDITDYGEGSGPVMKNKDTIIAAIRGFVAAFPDYKGDNFEAVSDGDRVFVYGDWSGTFKNDFMGMKATGKSFKVKDVDIFKFNDNGKIIEHRAIMPWSVIMDQVGAKPPKK
ncbi:MAG TPA: ester cyclase [Flavitalea sp.]|nr:ester cyclase [Flavitalea sp.]